MRAPFSIGGPVNAWAPFVGDFELFRARLSGEIATRVGLEVGLEVSAGATRATLPYEISFSFPDADALAANPFFRLEGSGFYADSVAAGFETEWPYLALNIAAIFELAVLAELEMGVLGENTTRKLLDFDFATSLPIVDLDTRDRGDAANREARLFGLDIGEIASVSGGFTPPPGVAGAPLIDLDLGDTLTVEFGTDGLDLFSSPAKQDEREATDARNGEAGADSSDPDAQTQDASGKQTTSVLDAFDTGPLATLDLRLPSITLEDRGGGGPAALDAPVIYTDRTETAAEAAESGDRSNNVADLTLDLDNILVEIVKSALAGPTLQKLPGLEGRVDLGYELGGFGAGAYFDYNLFDADLVLSLPIRQEVSVETQPLLTRLSFSRGDDKGNPVVNDGAEEAFFVTARMPRYSVYFNEGATFANADVAALLRQAAGLSARAAEDVALFADLDAGLIPGAFTGQTGGVAGGFVIRTENDPNWRQLSTFPEETEWLARSRPIVGVETPLEDLRPRDGARFKYVVYTDDTRVQNGVVDLATAVGHVDLAFADLVGFGEVFDVRVDAVSAPISATGLIEGAPSLDLIFPEGVADSVWVEVEHLARATVDNRTTLDFDMNIALSALEFAFGAYVQAFGGRFGIDFEFGPLWEKVYPILSTTLAALYDDEFDIATDRFTVGGETSAQPTDRWGFAIGAGGDAIPLVITGTPGDDVIDGARALGRQPGGTPVAAAVTGGGAGVDLLTFARLGAPTPLWADIGRGAAVVGLTPAALAAFEAAGGAGEPAAGPTTGRLAFSGVENLTGGRLGDLLAGDGGANRIDGGEGHDTLDGRGGADALFGGPGSDVLIMAGTTDGTEAFGGDGDDRLIAGGGRGLYDGGQGAPVGAGGLIPVDLDVIDYRAAPGAILIDLATGARSGPWVTGHELRNIEGVAGTAFDDTLQGDAGRSYFEGGDGDDLLIGDPLGEGLADRLSLPGGLDRLYGGSGDDTLVGGPGADMLDGGPGRDLVDYSADPTSVYVDMAAALTVDPERFAPLLIPAGTDPTDYARIDGQGWRGWAQGDKLRDVEDLRGSAFDDILFGDPDANRIEGGDGDDRIAGRFGADTLEGGAGNDVLWTRSAAAVAQGSYQPVLNRDPFTPGFQTTGTMAIGGLLLGHDPARLIGGEDRDLAILQWTPGFTVVQQNLLVSNYYDTKDPFERAVELRYEAPSLTQRLVASIEDGGALVEIAAASSDRTLFVTGARMAGSDAWADIGRWRSIDFFNGVADNIRELSDALRPFVGTDFGDWFADAPIAFTLDAPIRFDVAGLDGIEGLIGGVSAEFLIGSGIGDALYAGGGSDRVAGLGGDDVLSVGPGQPAEQIFSFPGRGYAGLAALERQLGEAYAGASSPRDPGAADQRLIDPVVRVIEPAGGFGDAALSAAAANGFAPRSAATQLFQNTPAEIDPFDPVARLGARPSAEVPARQAAIDALLVAYLAGPRDAAALDALSKALAATDQRLGEYAIVDGGPGVDTLDLRYDRGLDFLSRPGELAVMVDLEATATRFSVLPGFALPWTLTDTPSGNESDTPDPTAFSWKPLPAFTAGAAVGEVVFLRPALAETGPVGADRVTNAAAPPSAALPALLLGVENLIGTAYADRLFGDAGDNVIEGGAGAAVRRLAPVQGQANAVIAVYADWMDGRGGFDTLSYANAVAGVTLTLGQRADGALDVLASAGDAAGDLFAGFEALRGSEQRDRLGFTGADLPDDALTAVYSANAIAVVDGGGGSDLIAAARAGVTFLGGDGDDVIDVNRDPDPGRRTAADADGAFRATVGAALPAVGPMTMTVDGGAGVDVARLSGVGLAALTLDGDALRVTETVDPSFAATLDDPRRATLETTLLGVEYLEIGAGDAVETLALDNLDPVVGPQRALALSEDPWSVRRLFAAEGPGAPAPDRVATVESLSGAGVFALDGPGGPAPVTLGQVVDAAALSRLVFIPGQGFGFPLAEGPDAPRAAASLGLSFGGPGVAPQSRVIRVEPGDFDGASLGLATPTDVEHEPVVLAMIDRSDRDAEGRPTDDRVWLFLPSDIDERLVAAQQSRIDAVLDLRRWQLAEADLEADLAVFAQLPPFIRVAFQSVIDNIGLALNDARARQADAQSVIDAAVETQAEIQEEATRPIIDLPRADAYRVTGVTEGGTLWLAEEATASDPVLVTPVAVGTALARADLGRLVFVKDGGLVDADDAVSIAPIEALSVTILEVPTAGFVFDPVIALGLDPAAMTGAAPTEPATLLAGPSEGALFLRGVDGSRIPVAVGDALDAAQIAGLFFEAGIAREATDVSATELAAQIFALNRPTGDDGPDRSGLADGVGAVAAPADPTGLILQVDLGGPVAAEVDGLVVDMEAAGLTRLVVYDGAIRFRGAALDWRQWTVEQGGNGHFYAVGSDTRTTSSLNLYDALVRSDLEARREVPFELASIAEAAENDFAFNLFADDPTMFNDIFGPILGARALGAGRRWTWDDGSPWTFTAWRQGEPNDFGGAEDALQYSITRVDDEERLVLPTWNDHRTNYGAPGWVLESRGLATARNDVATGSQAADHIDGGAGDDLLSGGAGDDSIIGGAGRDTLAGGEGDDTLTGGAGADLFVMGPGGGYDVLLDFEGPWRQGGVVTDRIDVTGLGLSSLAQLRLTTESDGIALHAAGTTFFFKGTAQGDLVHFLNPQLYVGAPRYLGAAMPGIEALTLAVGDTIAADNLAGLRYRAGQDATGSAGQLRYEARDPWALPDGVAGLADPRDAATDGAARSGATITLIARNDAPRSADRAYHVSVDGALDGRVDVLRLKAIDPEGDAVSFRLIEGPAHGALEFDADGGFFYRPDAGFAGSDAFRFEATDGAATSAPYTVRLEVLDTSAPRGPEPGAERVEGFLRIGGLTADDWLVGDGGDNAFDAGPGDDRIEAGGGRSRVAAGSGDDTVIVGPSTGPVEIDGEGGDDAIDVVGDVGDGGAVRGGDGDDDIGVFGALRDGVLDGGPGDDTLRLDGADLAGTDLSGFAATIVTGPGRNRIDASELPDLGAISVEETTAGFDARFTLTATAGRTADFSALTLDAGEALFVDTEGQLGGDAFAADFSGVTLDPAAPPHLRYLGGAADEAITGSSGGDDLNGAGGADRITGGAGDDTLTGGADRDVFVATAANGDDVVTDFADGEDAVDLRQLGGEAALLAFLTATANDDGDTVLTFVSGGSMTLRGLALAAFDITDLRLEEGIYALDDAAAVDEDAAVTIDVLANDADADGDALTISGFGQGASGAVALIGGQLRYTPNANFSGADSFTYQVSDGGGDVAVATVSVTVNPMNDAPTARDDGFSTDEDTAVSGDLLADNAFGPDLDIDGDAVTVVAVNGAAASVGARIALASGALLTVNADGTFVYDPNAAFDALAASDLVGDGFTYVIADGNGGMAEAFVTVAVFGVNDAPLLSGPSAVSVAENATAAASFAAVDADAGQTPAFSIAGGADAALFAIDAATGSLRFRAAPDFEAPADAGGDNVYDVVVGAGDGTATATLAVAVTVTDVDETLPNRAPVAADDRYATGFGNVLTVDAAAGLLANDGDPDLDAITVASVGSAANGVANVLADGSFTYTPNVGFSGTETIAYTISDGFAQSTATLTIEVAPPVNAAPTPADDAFTVAEDAPLSGSLFADNGSGPDGDPDGDALVVTAVNGSAVSVGAQIALASGALLTVNADGTFAYDQSGAFGALNAGGVGMDGFEYAVSDGKGGTASATVSIAIAGETDLNFVLGTSGSDRLTGTNGADLIRPLGGRSDVVTGLGGADVFDFSDSTADGARDLRTIVDYASGEDMIELGSIGVLRATERAGLVTLYLEGDGDVISVRGVSDVDDIAFI